MKIRILTSSLKYILLCILTVVSFSVYAVDLGKKSISLKGTVTFKNNLKNTQSSINTGRDMLTKDGQKQIGDRSADITKGTGIVRDINKQRNTDCLVRGGSNCQKNKALTSPTLQPGFVLPKRTQPRVIPRNNISPKVNALPKINIPSKLKMPTVKLNSNQNKFQPANKGGFSSAPQKPRFGSNKQMPALKASVLGTTKSGGVRQGGFAPAGTRGQGGFAPAVSSGQSKPAPRQGGFAPPSLSRSVQVDNKLSTQQIQIISSRRTQIEMLRNTLANAKRAAEQRIARLGREQITSGADCDDTDPACARARPHAGY